MKGSGGSLEAKGGCIHTLWHCLIWGPSDRVREDQPQTASSRVSAFSVSGRGLVGFLSAIGKNFVKNLRFVEPVFSDGSATIR